jgi:hypothetical protein
MGEIMSVGIIVVYTAIGEFNSRWSYFSMMMDSLIIFNQFKKARGAIAFTGRMEFFSKKSDAIAVFEDEKSLEEFAHTGQHAKCMEKSKTIARLKRTKWSISGSALPLKLDGAIRIQCQK